MRLLEAVIRAGTTRTRPILLMAAALMVGAFVIILDPIFQGLTVSLLFGVGASTVLTLVVIPVLYYLWIGTGAAGAAIEAGPPGQPSVDAESTRQESGVGTARDS